MTAIPGGGRSLPTRTCLIPQSTALREDEVATDPAAQPPPPPLRPVSNGRTPGPSPEKAAALWSPPPLPSIVDVANHKLRPVALQHRGQGHLGSASDDVTDSRDSLLRELASLQLRPRSGSAGHRLKVIPPPVS